MHRTDTAALKRRSRGRAAAAPEPGPDAGQRALLANLVRPKTTFSHAACWRLLAQRLFREASEVFLKASWASGSDCGCGGGRRDGGEAAGGAACPRCVRAVRHELEPAMRSRKSARRNRTTPSRPRSAPSSTEDASLPLRACCSRPVCEPLQTCLIVAVNPVAQRLTVHPAKPASPCG